MQQSNNAKNYENLNTNIDYVEGEYYHLKDIINELKNTMIIMILLLLIHILYFLQVRKVCYMILLNI